jgi:hypothetical protein
MSRFNYGGKVCNNTIRPFAHLNNVGAGARIMRLVRWGDRTRLSKDTKYRPRYRDYPAVKYHEPYPNEWRRIVREALTRNWKAQIRNTADAALWWRYRVNALSDFDKEKYRLYLEDRKAKRLRAYRRKHTYVPWSLDELACKHKQYRARLTEDELRHRAFLKPDSFLMRLKDDFTNEGKQAATAYREWSEAERNDTLVAEKRRAHRLARTVLQANGDSVFGVSMESVEDDHGSFRHKPKVKDVRYAAGAFVSKDTFDHDLDSVQSAFPRFQELSEKTIEKISAPRHSAHQGARGGSERYGGERHGGERREDEDGSDVHSERRQAHYYDRKDSRSRAHSFDDENW